MACITQDQIGVPLPPLVGLVATGAQGEATVLWQNSKPYPYQFVTIMYRLADLSNLFSDAGTVLRDSGSKTITGLIPDGFYIFWVRPETTEYYGAWQSLVITASDGSLANLTEVIHNGVAVEHNGVQVLAPYNYSTDVPGPPVITNEVTYEGDTVTLNDDTVTYGV